MQAATRTTPSRRAPRARPPDWSVLSGQKVGVITNPTGILTNLRTIVDEMHESGAVDIVGVFGPEHGFRGTAQAGGSEGNHTDPRTGLTVYDAYGANAAKMTTMFRTAGVETVVFDIQDVGSASTPTSGRCTRRCGRRSRSASRFVVLDRPNPIGGPATGPMMTTPYTSGVGAKEIVQQHGMTVGELARFFDGEFLPADAGRPVDLHVVEVQGLAARRAVRRHRPAVGDAQSRTCRPPTPRSSTRARGCSRATDISEGRGTTRPFELVGAP